jgi:hypothetical protein
MGTSFIQRVRPSPLHPADRRDLVDLAREVPPDGRVTERAEDLAGLLDHLGLPRLLRLLVAGSIPPLWYEIAVLHFRGSFQSRYMWLPVAYLPLEMAAGFLAGAVDTRTTRTLFRALSWGTAALGAFGTLMHLRGVRRQMGGLYNWRYNGLTGPPVIAPPQVALFGLLGALGVSGGSAREVIRRLRLLEVTGQLLLAVEAGYYHYQNYYADRVQYTPVMLAPALALVQAAAEGPGGPLRRAGRRLEALLSAVATLAGLVGFAFHVKNVRSRTGGLSWQNLFYGAPLVAPLQLTGQGLLGLVAAYFDRGRK